MRWKSAGLPQIGSPRIRTVPLLGLSWPVISFMNVDLPAPLGPSKPVMPGGTATVTSLSPDTCPYHFDRCSAAIIGVSALISGHDLDGANPALENEHGDRNDHGHHDQGDVERNRRLDFRAEDCVGDHVEHLAWRDDRPRAAG